MFTTGCCIICLSARKWCVEYIQQQIFNYMVYKHAKNWSAK